MKPFFADTYAIFAWLAGEPRYVKRFRGSRFITGWWNLLECHFVQTGKGVDDATAAGRLRQFESMARDADWDTLKRASVFRRKMIRDGRRCSYVDAVGYALARQEQIPFLTGDSAFKSIDGVEFLPATPNPPARGAGAPKPR